MKTKVRYIVNSNRILPDFIDSRRDAIDYTKRLSSGGKRFSLTEQHIGLDGKISLQLFHGTFQFGEKIEITS